MRFNYPTLGNEVDDREKSHIPRLELITTVLAPNGQVKLHREQPVNSWMKQAALVYMAYLSRASQSMTSVAGTARTLTISTLLQEYIRLDANVADTHGIIIGTGTAAVDRDDIGISGSDETNKIDDGSASGEMNYLSQAIIQADEVITGGYRNSLVRTFANASGGSITVGEVAVYADIDYSTTTGDFFMMLRDLVSPTIAVADGDSLVVRYNFNWTV